VSDSPTPPSSPSSRAPATEGERRVHDVKCWPEPFAALRRDEKPYEIRVNDRDYQVGDVLRLREWLPMSYRHITPVDRYDADGYTGEEEERVVTYMTPGGEWGLPEHLCVLGLARLASRAPATEGEGLEPDRPLTDEERRIAAVSKQYEERFVRIACQVFRATLAERGLINVTDSWDDGYEADLRVALATRPASRAPAEDRGARERLEVRVREAKKRQRLNPGCVPTSNYVNALLDDMLAALLSPSQDAAGGAGFWREKLAALHDEWWEHRNSEGDAPLTIDAATAAALGALLSPSQDAAGGAERAESCPNCACYPCPGDCEDVRPPREMYPTGPDALVEYAEILDVHATAWAQMAAARSAGSEAQMCEEDAADDCRTMAAAFRTLAALSSSPAEARDG
jgi:hypothetical protein